MMLKFQRKKSYYWLGLYIKENIQSFSYVDNANIIEDMIVGDTKRFVLIEYVIKDEDSEIQSTEELFENNLLE